MAEDKVTKRISGIKYSVMSPKEVLRHSVVKIITPELYDKYGFPVEGGLMDLRLGVLEPGLVCKTDGQSYKNSEGHFGHLELARPVLNVVFIDDIAKALKATCCECHRVLVPEDKIAQTTEEFANLRVELGSKVNNMSSKELKRDLLLFARNNPQLFISLANDDNVQLRNVAIRAAEAGIINLSPDQRTFTWGSNGRKLMNVPFDENPYSAFAAFLKTDEGVEIYKSIDKKL